MKYILTALLFVPVQLFAQSTAVPLYRVYSVAQQTEISIEALANYLQQKDVIFFGEEHNDSITHTLELKLLQELHKAKHKNVILSMEMFEDDVQLVLDEYCNGVISEKNFSKDARLWSNYKDYRPMVEYARQNGIYVLAANAPGRYTSLVSRSGLTSLIQLSKAAKSLLPPLPVDTLTGRYYKKFDDMLGGHEGMGSLKLYQAQNLWDATMAWHIARLMKRKSKTKQILHITGRFHSDEKLGTYKQLMRYAPKLNCVNISAFSDASFTVPNWDEWKTLGDFIIITKPDINAADQQ